MLTRDATVIYSQAIVKPPLAPPNAVFPVAWTILYALMGIGLARILLSEPANKQAEASSQTGGQANIASHTDEHAEASSQSAQADAQAKASSHADEQDEMTSNEEIETKRHLSERTKCTWLFFAQLFFNLGWCYIFFLYQLFGLSLAWIFILFALVLAMTIAFFQKDKVAGLIQLPYVLWMFFAVYLNAGVFLLNR